MTLNDFKFTMDYDRMTDTCFKRSCHVFDNGVGLGIRCDYEDQSLVRWYAHFTVDGISSEWPDAEKTLFYKGESAHNKTDINGIRAMIDVIEEMTPDQVSMSFTPYPEPLKNAITENKQETVKLRAMMEKVLND